ncbi:hypothetical protein [Rhizobium sp. Rhizsp82]|uniref:hypothetical protein n=1 Tax=Rhizobium sp. Rhizsp82 TaxID=3243057 RepID=UPI0039B5DC7E
MVTTAIKFQNQIYSPTFQLLRDLAATPLVMDPDSNSLLHRLEGLCIHTNHFGERNNLPIKRDQKLQDIANSAKHSRSKNPVHLKTFGTWEYADGLYRFISHGIEATWNDGATADAVDCLIRHVNDLGHKLGATLPQLSKMESHYGFYTWAFAYHVPMISAGTLSSRLKIVRRAASGYAAFSPTEVKFVALAEHLIGQEPTTHFPQA